MKKRLTNFEKHFSAIAFAECGEHETARLLMKEGQPVKKNNRKHLSKINTAEAHAAGSIR